MSTRRVQSSAIASRTLGVGNVPVPRTWVRNPSWLPLTAVSDSDQRFRGLVAVFPQGAYLALSAAGAYTVNWGDGSGDISVSSGVQANRPIAFSSLSADTSAPVSLTIATDRVGRTAHGYSNGMEVRFYNIVSTTGVVAAQTYYVINANPNDFQVSLAVGGDAIDLATSDGTATLLPYRQAIVNVTPQTNLTTFNLNLKNDTIGLQAYETGWLDLELSGTQLTSSGLTIGGTNVRFAMCERAAIRSIGGVTNLSNLFDGFRELQSVILGNTASVTNMFRMFANCASLVTAPFFNTAACNNMPQMFIGCTSLTTVPLYNTAASTNVSSMFNSCVSLVTVPSFNLANVNNASEMFTFCRSLTTVPLFNFQQTSFALSTASMFNDCTSLTTVPLFNTLKATDMNGMFRNCTALTTVPLFNTVAATNMSQMFLSCNSLTSIPLFNTAAVTNMSSMFQNCYRLTNIPLFNTASVTNMSAAFAGCLSLTTVPLLNTVSMTNMNSMFSGCASLTTVPSFNAPVVTDMGGMFINCSSLKTISPLNTPILNNTQSMFEGCVSLQSIPPFNNSSFIAIRRMFRSCPSLQRVPLMNTGSVQDIDLMFDGCSSLSSIPAFNFSAGASEARISALFANCMSVSRIEATGIRFTFSVSGCKLGAAQLNEIYTNLPTVTGQIIYVSGNPGTTGDDPTIAELKGWTVNGS